MIVKRIYDEKLAQASYLIGCERQGEAIIVDPNRDVEQYIDLAAEEGLRIAHVTETHIHADFVSGSRELAARTGARLYLSDEGGPDWAYRFAEEAGAVTLRDGATIEAGCVVLQALHTPGHTPEHLCFLVTDTAAADAPMALLTGDCLFVGDVGRPDLLERAAGLAGTMEEAARDLFRSLALIAELPDHLQIWPGHGAGSPCGRSLSGVPTSTIGYERRYNWAYGINDEAAFLAAVLEGQPDTPPYFAVMKQVNRDGPSPAGGHRRPPRFSGSPARFLESGSVLLDIRPAASFAAGHIPGSINVPYGRSFTTWAGWMLPYDAAIYLLVDQDRLEHLDGAIGDLAVIGLDHTAGYFGDDAIQHWVSDGGDAETTPLVEAEELAKMMGRTDVQILDVRSEEEWKQGHVPGASHIPLGHLRDHFDELSRHSRIVVHCQSGGRSAIAASLLQAAAFTDVIDFRGGFSAWEEANLPIEKPAPTNGS